MSTFGKRSSSARLALVSIIFTAQSAALCAAALDVETPPAAPVKDITGATQAQGGNRSLDTRNLDTVVVTGNAAVGGVKKIDASYSITALSSDEIKQTNPLSTADLLKWSPGVHVESSGGQSGANVEVAGFPSASQSPYVTLQLNGSPLFPQSGQAYLEQSTMFRLDDTISRVEMVQGGPSILYGNGQPGLTSNFILKEGGDTPTGDIGVTYGSEGMYRLDGFLGFPIGKDSGWYGSVGGFWRQSDGVRNPQYSADKGGQLTATLTRNWGDGSLMFYARHLKDRNQFVTGTPIYNPSRGQFSPYPGFSPLSGTMGSKADQYEFLQTTPCFAAGCSPGGIGINMANGRGPTLSMLGANFDWDFGNGWTLSDRLGFTAGTVGMVAFYSTGKNPTTLTNYISGVQAAQGLPPGLNASAVYANNGEPADMGQNVLTQELRYVRQSLRSISNELHVSKELFDGNTLTIGNYTTSYDSTETAFQGSNMLLQAKSNPRPIVVNVGNGRDTWMLSSAQGFTAAPTTALWAAGSGTNTAFFLSDSWKLGSWLFDAGMRREYQRTSVNVANKAVGDLDNNPYTLYNNKATYLAAGTQALRYDAGATSWTLGGNYEFNSHMSAYVRASEGVYLPSFSNLISFPRAQTQTIHSMELGYKYQADWIYADIGLYRRRFYGVPNTLLVAVGTTSQQISYTYGSAADGVNFVAVLRPLKAVSVTFSGDYTRGKYTHSNGCLTYQGVTDQVVCNPAYNFDGKQLARQPTFQVRVTPMVNVPTAWGSLSAWVTYEYIGNHYGDMLEQQPLGQYHDLAIGVVAKVGAHWEFRLQGTNITNEIGLTEGNARVLGAANSGGVILGRSIEGREVNGQAKYNF